MQRVITNSAQVAIGPPPRIADTRETAHRSSFYAAMRVLPAPRREAMFAIYAFCRAVDDIADGPGDHASRVTALEAWRSDIDALFRDVPPPRVAGLVEPVRSYGLAREDFMAIIDGVEMDACSDIVAPDVQTLDLYCDRVASAVGRLAVRVFGMPHDDGIALARHLGRALQLTNILRDVDEDAANGRLYVPRDALRAAGIEHRSLAATLEHPAFARACMQLAEEARRHFAQANAIMGRHPLAMVRAPRLMSSVYGGLLARMMARGFASPRVPVRTGRAAILWSVLRHGIVRAPRRFRRGDRCLT